ncbi:MAG: glycosyltransferase family 4 protein [Nanoarchaeota archaeon]|nr:glycosyltransferase family 4 protein [Nanoarchaeota archaeon]
MNKDKLSLIIFPGFFLPHVGGLETHVDEFTKYLSKKEEYSITIFAPNIPNTKEEEIIHNKVKVIRYPALELVSNFPIPKFWLPRFWKLFFSLNKEKASIIMTRTRFFTNSLLGVIFSKIRLRKRIKLVHVEHGSGFVKLASKFKTNVAYLYDKTFGKIVFKASDRIVPISEAVNSFVKKEFTQKKLSPVIRRGVDFEIYSKVKENKQLKNKFKGKTILTFVGRLYKWKGVENSIKAYMDLPEKIRKKTVFLIVGYGEDLDRLKELAKNCEGIYFLGKRDFKDTISILNLSDIYVHSAYAGGGLSNSLLQAMYCNCACVASPNEGANEVVFDKKTGLLLEDNSVQNLKYGIIEMIENNSLKNSCSKAGKEYIKKEYDWEKVVEAYEKVFREI